MPPAFRTERPADVDAVREVTLAAFGRDAEARLVDRVRREASPVVSLVAEIDGAVRGHILFSPVTVGRATRSAPLLMGLGPMAVHPGSQRSGLGGGLIRAGLDACRQLDAAAVFVLGHAEYYPRFGFVPARPHGFGFRGPEADPWFFVAELTPGALDGLDGDVHYHPAFDAA